MFAVNFIPKDYYKMYTKFSLLNMEVKMILSFYLNPNF